MLKLGKKKPKQERSKFTVDAILEAVTRIMESEGMVGLTTNKIAEKAGVSVGSLYQYFKNKESIFESILLRMTEENTLILEKIISTYPQGMSIRTIIELVVQSHFEQTQRMGKVATALFEYAPQLLPHSHFKKADERIIRFLIDKVNEKNVSIRPQDKEKAFFVCSQAVRGVIFMSVLSYPPEQRQAVINELIDMLSIYLEKPIGDL